MGLFSGLGELPLVGPILGGPTREDLIGQQLGAQSEVRGEVRQALDPEAILARAQSLQPFIREQNLALGSQLENQVATLLARRGATETGFGQGALTAALAAPGLSTIGDSLQMAIALAQAEAGAIAGVPLGSGFAPSQMGELGQLLGGVGSFMAAI